MSLGSTGSYEVTKPAGRPENGVVPRDGPTDQQQDTIGQSHTRVRPDSGTTTSGVSSIPIRNGVTIVAVTPPRYTRSQ
jgi:hypothetical protein